MAEAQAMHPDFGRWHAAISLDADPSRREARWNAVVQIADDASHATVETLLRLAFATRQAPAAANLDAIRQAFKSADDTFETSGNDRELQILAAACLAVLMESDRYVESDKHAPLTALSVTTVSLGGARGPDLPMDLAQLGEEAIARWAEVSRTRPATASLSVGVPKVDFAKAAAAVREQANAEGFAAALTLAAESTRKAMEQFAARQADAIRLIDKFVRVQDEELQMLWWLIGQRSISYDCAFGAVPADAQPLVFASELAGYTESLPGPASVKALLSRAGLKERKKPAITAAVNAARPDWLQGLLGEENAVSPVSTPIHEAIKRQLETGPGSDWIAGWAATTGVAQTLALSSLELGNLFYRERLLRRFR